MATLNKIKAFSNEYKRFPLTRTISLDERNPVDAFKALKKVSRNCFILESVEYEKERGRWTFLGFDPKLELTCTNGDFILKGEADILIKTNNPDEYIKQVIDDNKSPKLPGLPPFTGGLVGYFAYDYIKYSEPGLNKNFNATTDEENFKDVDLMLFDKIIAFDNFKNEIILIVSIKTDALEENFNHAQNELDIMERILTMNKLADIPPLKIKSAWTPLFTKSGYCEMVEKAKKYIYEGDIFQVVLSNRLCAYAEGSLFETYLILRKTNPSPYMFYFSSDDLEIAGASPETLVSLKDGILHTFPLAGTRKRGKTPEEDKILEQELLSDPKELAEHNMLVDLGRNDIGKISKFGSVIVEKYLTIERFSTVMHIGSTVCGVINHDNNAIDAINAILPAGTLSGAPKIRACEIINELENNKRGIYGGAIGYIDFTGNMDVCIAIRIAFKKNGKVFIRSGAGVVADSISENEYEECNNKMAAVQEALKNAISS
jgi:anthranilate synthase component 1